PAPLRDLAMRSGAYLAGREAVGMVIRLAGVVLVVREIGPGAYGLYSAAAAFVVFAATLAQMGAEVYLVRSPGTVPGRRNSEVFSFLVVSTVLVTVLGLGLTFLVGPWLRPVGVVLPLQVLLLSVPINVLWAPAQAAIERRLAFRRMGLLELGGDLALYGTAVPLALCGFGLWSLVAGYFAWQAWLLVGSLVLSRMRPRPAWSWATSRDLLHHGLTYSLSTWLVALRGSAAVLIVGTFAGATGVGFVSFAQRLVTTLNFTSRGVHRVGIAAIARAGRPDRPRLSRAMEEGTLLLMLVAAAPFAAFGLAARWLVPAVFGGSWDPALPLFVLLAVVAVLKVPSTVQCTVLFAHGRNLPVALAAGIQLVTLSVGSVLLIHTFDLGLVGYGYASLLMLLSIVCTHRAAARYGVVRYRRLVLPVVGLVPPVLAPVLPLPWVWLTLLPAAVLCLVPPTRREIVQLTRVVASLLPGRAGVPAVVPAPAAVVAPAVVPVTSVDGSGGPPPPADRGGDEMRFNGTFAPGMLRLPGGGTRQRRAAPSDRRPPVTGLPEPAPATTAPDVDPAMAPPEPVAATAPPQAAPSIALDATLPEPAPVVHEPGRPVAVADPVAAMLAPADDGHGDGQVSLGTLLARAGRLMGALDGTGGSLLVGAFEVVGHANANGNGHGHGHASADGHPNGHANGNGAAADRALVGAAAGALRAELRFDDPIACVDSSLLVVAAPLVPGASDGPTTAAHLYDAVGRAVEAAGGAALPG
ncbi:MAG: oligosaccharide flippase family protein, partial [Acidimicrobiales bacterium]